MKTALEAAVALARHPCNDADRYNLGSDILPHLRHGENIDTGALRILATELSAAKLAGEGMAKALVRGPQLATLLAEKARRASLNADEHSAAAHWEKQAELYDKMADEMREALSAYEATR